jgi:HTH-type transcriptional regulator / antitoxin HigA
MSPMAQKNSGLTMKVLPDNFLELQSKLFMLRPIHSKKDYATAIKVVSDLGSREHLTKIQSDYLESLSNNIMAYESKKMEIDKTDPVEILCFLLKENGLTGSDLGNMLGNRALGSKILSKKRNLSKANIKTLAERFSVSPALFL